MAEWRKDQEFVQLQTLIKDEKIPVVRGKYGTTKTVKVWDLVVGDVVLLGAGARVPADCLAVEADRLEVLEPVHVEADAEGEGAEPEMRRAAKGAAAPAADRKGGQAQGGKLSADDPDPFLLAGSIVQSGHCRAVVCAVGESSTRGIVDRALKAPEGTALQRKLKNLEGQFSLGSLIAAAVIFVVLMVRMGIRIASRDTESDPPETVQGLLLKKLP